MKTTGETTKKLAIYVMCFAREHRMTDERKWCFQFFLEKYPFQWLDIMRNGVNATEELKGCKPRQLPLEELVKVFNDYMMQEMKDYDSAAKNLPGHKRITYSRAMALKKI